MSSSGIMDDLTDHFKETSLMQAKKKGPAYYLILLRSTYMLQCFVEDAVQWIKVDAGALTSSKGEISETFMPVGMSLALQQGLFFSWFGNKRLRQSMGTRFDGSCSHVTAYHTIWDEFKKAERNQIQDGVVYSTNVQLIKLPFKCAGLVQQLDIKFNPTDIQVAINTINLNGTSSII